MADKKEIKKYCSGIDCLTCNEAETCIYRIANELQEQLKRKEQECEELRKEKAEIKKYLGISDKTIIQRLEELQEFKDKLKISEYNYKQALDEIEEIAKHNNFLVRDPFCGPGYRDLSGQILSIINKAKEK